MKLNRFTNGSLLIKNFIGTWRKKFREYVNQCLTSGFLPRTFLPLQLLGRFLAKVQVFLQIGKIRVIGAENLRVKDRVIFCPNHSAMFDAPVVFSIMKRWPRYMTAYEEMRGVFGLKAVVMGAFGCFAVDRSHGKTVLEPAIKVLVSGSPLVIFPEGKISSTGEYLPFKKGPAIIANAAYEQLGMKEPVGIVPIHICYHCRDEKTATEGFGDMGFKWRCGVTVTIGKPIYMHELASRKPEDVMAAVHAAITSQACSTTPGDKPESAE